MAQTYTSSNLLKFQNGKQNDVAIADGNAATSASKFVSLDIFEVQKEPEIVDVNDAEGNRSTNSARKTGNFSYPFTFGGFTEIEKIGDWLFYATGTIASVQDGGTGAFEHTFTMLNNVILPKFTLFYAVDGEHSNTTVGYKRLTGCHITSLKVSGSGSEIKFEGTGMGLNEDAVLNSTSSLAITNVTAIEFQTSGLFRYTLSATDLSTVTNGDVLDTSGATGISNATNIGKFIIVTVNDASDFVEVINAGRTDNTDDETGLTATGSTVEVIIAPTYAVQDNVLLMRNSCVKDAVNLAGIAAATQDGLSEFNFEINNNSEPLYEGAKSQNPLEMIAKAISVDATFTQSITTTSGANAVAFRDGVNNGVVRAWEFRLEDTSVLLGSSVTHSPLLRLTMPEALGVPARVNMQQDDLVMYDWVLNNLSEQSTQIVLRNTTASYGP